MDEEADRERQEEDALEEVCLDEEADRQTQGEDSLEKKEQEEEDVTCAAEDLEKLDTLAKVVRGLDFSFSSPEGQAAREAVAAAERALEEADERAEELEEEEELHFGEEQQFWELSQACFDKRVGAGRDVATFTVCPFKEVKQVVGGTFKLGHFEALEPTEHELGLWVMRFEGGEKCWNGPKRSAKVYLGCGAATELVSADEPSRCEYRLLLRTPAACDARFAAAAGLSPPPAS
uniref:MRH domain-containing protein n=1 Tax=Heterosigma akashiwo TaxID=2829 RepID=A0A7S3XQP5_HETAK